MSFGLILPAALRPGIDSALNRNDCQVYLLADKGGQCIGLTTMPPSSTGCLIMLGASTSWSPKGPFRNVEGNFT